jgi:hypothetical protein
VAKKPRSSQIEPKQDKAQFSAPTLILKGFPAPWQTEPALRSPLIMGVRVLRAPAERARGPDHRTPAEGAIKNLEINPMEHRVGDARRCTFAMRR